MIIDGLPTLSAPQGTDEIPVERGTTTYKAALNALPYSFQVDITTGTHDLNDYTTAGLYYFKYGVTISNAPNSATDGWLTVYVTTTGSAKQVWQRVGSNPTTFKDFYMRLFYNGVWGNWCRIGLDGVAVSLTITRTENNLADATQVGRLAAHKKNGMLYLCGNLQVKPNVNSGGDFVEIAKITGWNAVDPFYAIIPPQGNNGSTIMTIAVYQSGSIQLYCAQNTHTSNTWYRFSACVPEA